MAEHRSSIRHDLKPRLAPFKLLVLPVDTSMGLKPCRFGHHSPDSSALGGTENISARSWREQPETGGSTSTADSRGISVMTSVNRRYHSSAGKRNKRVICRFHDNCNPSTRMRSVESIKGLCPGRGDPPRNITSHAAAALGPRVNAACLPTSSPRLASSSP